MTPPNVIPTLDPNPLPAPYWVFELLLVTTFFLHIVAMNFDARRRCPGARIEVAFQESRERPSHVS